ncbi:MAG TPA: hypothetical protein ENF23_01655 [Methanosarcinales archaeon]|nr:MAG: hypothetical protein DRO03_05895 [Methanosarcinales archaeon]HDN64996.1 hypothetical protein [Methanosarcinales archaeon]
MMKKILLICILLLSFSPYAVGFEQYAMQDVVIGAYLIDLSYTDEGNTAIARETIVFMNNGDANHTDDLCIIVPETATVMYMNKVGHQNMNASAIPVEYDQVGEVLYWNATIAPRSMAMYSIMYTVPITESGEFVKNLDPAVMNYPITRFTLNTSADDSIKLTDANGVVIRQDPAEDRGSGALYEWTGGVPFKELHVMTSSEPQSANTNKWIAYGLIAVLIIAALSYPIIHVRNNRLREKDGGNKLSCASCSVCSGDDEKDKEPRGGDWDEMDEIITEISQAEEDLLQKKKAILAVLNKLEEDRDAGAVSDADYKRISSKYEKQAIEIMKQLDKM